jgi:hypothetical protein
MEVQTTIENWLQQNAGLLVQCPHQPGNLKITKHCCSERRKKAAIQNYANLMEGNFIDYMHKMGLFICLHCQEDAATAAISS